MITSGNTVYIVPNLLGSQMLKCLQDFVGPEQVLTWSPR